MIFTTSKIRIYKQMSLNALYAIVYGFILRFPDRHRSDSPEVRKPGIIRIASPARQLHTPKPASPASALLNNTADRAILVFVQG